jgi:hypothetical protein
MGPTIRRLATIGVAAVFSAGAAVGVGVAQSGGGLPDHPHMLLQRLELGEVDGTFAILGWRRCIDLAAGEPVPLVAHHRHLHVGDPGEQLFIHAGHGVAPGAPLSPWEGCAGMEAALPILLPDE